MTVRALLKPSEARPKPRKVTGANGETTDRRSQIVDVAARLFAEYGYEATSVRQIADEANILAGSLYHHFATKEEMLHDIMRTRIEQLVEDNRIMAKLPVDAEQRLVISVIRRFQQYVDQWEFHAILLQEGRIFRRHSDFDYIVQAKAQAFAMQQATLEEGVKAGLFRADMDTYLLIGTISRMLSSAAAWFRSGDIFSSDRQSRYTLESMIDFHVEAVLRLVRAPDRLTAPVPHADSEPCWDTGAEKSSA
jgi:TetR/AcrR family transcriptional regulator, cholesterol catabolism regulator